MADGIPDMQLCKIFRRAAFWCSIILLLGTRLQTVAQTPLAVYTDSLVNGFQDWGWATHNYANTSPVHSGSNSVSVTISTVNYDGLQICRASAVDSTPYASLTFWINGGTGGGQKLQVYGLVQLGSTNNVGQSYFSLDPLQTNVWQKFTIPLSALGVANKTNFTGFVIQSRIGAAQPTYYLDDIQLDANPPPSLVHIGVNAALPLRAADARWLGLNTAIWDGYFDTSYTSNALNELGTTILRFPGGSSADDYHWATDTSGTNTWIWGTSFYNFIHIATNAGVQAIITVNYGDGTPSEAAAWVGCANITNHLNFKYWEVGNENYGTWENDTNVYPHDPYTYAVRAAQYITQMKAVDPTIKIGVPVVTGEDNNNNGYTNPVYNARTSSYHFGWTPVVLATLQSLGVTPDFLIYHVYPEYGTDSDPALLQDSANWAPDAANLRQQINDYIGANGTNIELLCTENNADADNGGKQSTSIVNGLYLADSLAQLEKTEFNSFVWWDLRNGQNTTDADFDSSLYGWRTYGDLGIIGNANTRYPTFYTFKLMQFFARAGDSVLNATSDYSLLSSYAARKADGALAVLVINKSGTTNFNAQITLTNFIPFSNATARSFGITQDEATRTNSAVPGAQDIATNSVAGVRTNFTATFPPYSVTLLTLAPAAAQLQSSLTSDGQFVLQVQGQAGVPYVVQTSTDLASWNSVSTNLLTSNVLNLTNLIPAAPQQFWRVVWQP
jgi:hypothetical protein